MPMYLWQKRLYPANLYRYYQVTWSASHNFLQTWFFELVDLLHFCIFQSFPLVVQFLCYLKRLKTSNKMMSNTSLGLFIAIIEFKYLNCSMFQNQKKFRDIEHYNSTWEINIAWFSYFYKCNRNLERHISTTVPYFNSGYIIDILYQILYKLHRKGNIPSKSLSRI